MTVVTYIAVDPTSASLARPGIGNVPLPSSYLSYEHDFSRMMSWIFTRAINAAAGEAKFLVSDYATNQDLAIYSSL